MIPSKVITPEQKQKLIKGLIDFYATDRDEEIGIIAATEIIEFLLQTLGTTAYNNGVEDARTYMKKKMEEMDVDMGASLIQSE